MDTLIKNGLVVHPTMCLECDIGIDGGRIVALGELAPAATTDIIDAAGMWVLPGAIDAHTHMGWPGSADDWETGTRAAACGGVTTIVDFAVQYPDTGLRETIAAWHKKANNHACIDYSFHLAISHLPDNAAEQIDVIMAEGVTGFKMWMTSSHSGGLGVQDETIYRVMELAAQRNALVGLHCENDNIITLLAQRFLEQGKSTPRYHRLSRPPWVEADAIRHVSTMAQAAGCQLYIPHLSSGAGLQAVREAANRGVAIVAETCPQFLVLTDDMYERPDGANFIMSPPIKGAGDQTELWRALENGEIITVGSDHCPYAEDMKGGPDTPFTQIANGVPGVETILPLLYTEGVVPGRITPERLAAITSENPAKLFGLYPRKGAIVPGADADLVIFDPHRSMPLTHDNLHSNLSYSLYAHITALGTPRLTMSRGRIVYEDGGFKGQSSWGSFVARETSHPEIWQREQMHV